MAEKKKLNVGEVPEVKFSTGRKEVRIQVLMSRKLKDTIDEFAKENGVSNNLVINEILEAYFKLK